MRAQGFTLAPISQRVEHRLIGIEIDLFVDDLVAFDSPCLPDVVRQRLAFDSTDVRRQVNPALDTRLNRWVEHDGRVAPSISIGNVANALRRIGHASCAHHRRQGNGKQGAGKTPFVAGA
jgi:hypothetical protein